jgi:hypothetical protein
MNDRLALTRIERAQVEHQGNVAARPPKTSGKGPSMLARAIEGWPSGRFARRHTKSGSRRRLTH